MAKAIKLKPVTKEELEVLGVSLVMSAFVGDKLFRVSVSPVDYEVFKSSLYRNKLHNDLIKRIEHDLNQITPEKD